LAAISAEGATDFVRDFGRVDSPAAGEVLGVSVWAAATAEASSNSATVQSKWYDKSRIKILTSMQSASVDVVFTKRSN
jgi:hypothetical protein